MEYLVEFDTLEEGYFETYIVAENFAYLTRRVIEILEEAGGGHADILDEDGEFVEDIEV